MIIQSILAYFDKVERGKIVTTRDVLHLADRAVIDKALSKMVKDGMIVRIARGMFIHADAQVPSVELIARVKAESFGRKIVAACSNLAAELNLVDEPADRFVFATSGRSSSFLCIHGRVVLRGIGPRKLKLADSSNGEKMRALWFLGKTESIVGDRDKGFEIIDSLMRKNPDVSQLLRWIPYWLSDDFVDLRQTA